MIHVAGFRERYASECKGYIEFTVNRNSFVKVSNPWKKIGSRRLFHAASADSNHQMSANRGLLLEKTLVISVLYCYTRIV